MLTSKDGLLQTTLNVQDRDVEIAGSTVKGRVYNGKWPGPTLHVKPGDTIKIELVNDLDQPTNLHTHGFHVSPSGISDNVLRTFGPGEQAPIEIHLPRDIAVGTYWYHAHLHGLTESQVIGGLSGVLIVDGLEQQAAGRSARHRAARARAQGRAGQGRRDRLREHQLGRADDAHDQRPGRPEDDDRARRDAALADRQHRRRHLVPAQARRA